MKVNKSAPLTDFDEFVKLVTKLKKEKRSFNFNGNINNEIKANNETFNISWTVEEEV